MYLPEPQRVDDIDEIWSFIEGIGFGSLICADDERVPHSTQVAFVRREGHLYTHLSRANPQAEMLADGRPVLAQFLGPHSYISPSVYELPGDVPTWNYTEACATGTLRGLDDAGTRWVVEETVREHERHRSVPVGPEGMQSWIDRLLPAVAAFEMDVAKVEGRFKLSRDETLHDRLAIIEDLEADGGDNQSAIASLMRGTVEESAG